MALLFLGIPQVGRAQEYDFPDESLFAPFAVTEIGGEIGFEADYLEENQQQNNGNRTRFSNRTFEEYMKVRLNGYSVHPRFLSFRTMFKVGYLQQKIERSGDAITPVEDEGHWKSSRLDDYDIYVQLLKDHPLSLDLFARREHEIVRELFTDRIRLETEDYGGTLRWKKGRFPMEFALRENKLRQVGTNTRSDSENKTFEYTLRNNHKDWMRSTLRYRYQDYSQNFQAMTRKLDIDRMTNLKSHDLNLDNTIFFGDERQNNLHSALRFFKQSGDQDIKNFYWRERLQIQHSADLRTYYLFNYLRNDYRQSSVQNYNAEAGLDHNLFESLSSHLDIHGRKSEFSMAEDTEYGFTGRLNYRKQTPWGFLTAGYGLTIDEVSRNGSSGNRPVFDERVVLKENETVYLSRPDVRANTLIVTDQSNLEIYTEGLDYRVRTLGNRLGLEPVIGGQLFDDQGNLTAVLVDYEADVSSDIDYRSTSQNLYARYDIEKYLKGLSFYYRWHELSDSGNTGMDDTSILSYDRWLAGAAFRWRWLNALTEYEQYHSNFTDYNQIRAQIEGSHRLSPSLQWGWYAGFLNVDYDGEQLVTFRNGMPDITDRYSDSYYGGTTLRGKIRSRGYWKIEARGRKETGITEETLLGIIGRVGMKWRQLRFTAGGRVEQRERFQSDRDNMHLFLQVSREF